MTAESFQSTTTRLARQELGACTLIEDLLPLYIEGEVSPSSRDLIVEHLARCERCAGFLAGAQSVRAQLRRENTQRAAVITDKLPEQRAIGVVRLGATMVAMLFLCAWGAAASMFGWDSLQNGNGDDVVGAALLVAGAFALLLGLARTRGSLSAERLLGLVGSCALGGLATMPLVAEHSDAPAMLLGLVLGALALVGVWMSVWRVGTAAPQPDPQGKGNPGRWLVGGGLLLMALVPLFPLSMFAIGSVHPLWSTTSTGVLIALVVAMIGRTARR
jgi:hypothetical protein